VTGTERPNAPADPCRPARNEACPALWPRSRAAETGWIIRRTELALDELYSPTGRYWYTAGWNLRAVLALLVGGVLAIGGSYSTVGADGTEQGPFPADGLIPFLKPLADYGWAVGLASALLLYTLLSSGSRTRR